MLDTFINKPPLSLITIQTTHFCNMKCNYCYFDDDQLTSCKFIDLNLTKKIVDNIISYRQNNNLTGTISLTFHGGEPLILGYDYYDKILEYINIISSNEGQLFDVSIQTNLTLLDDNFSDIFSKYNVSLSTSIDGPQHLHNNNRDTYKLDTHTTVLNNITLARKYGLNVGAICMIT